MMKQVKTKKHDFSCPACFTVMRRDKVKEHAFRRHLPMCFQCIEPINVNLRQIREKAVAFL